MASPEAITLSVFLMQHWLCAALFSSSILLQAAQQEHPSASIPYLFGSFGRPVRAAVLDQLQLRLARTDPTQTCVSGYRETCIFKTKAGSEKRYGRRETSPSPNRSNHTKGF
ncbi:hypothetical protein EYF80_009576 [Liparis tanakae]|uniref:Secreted protein n=1 Tax=Liparis tanakae TaxID=230148 RepID=A0A4Z2IQZ8_9TELE|nr:hypothetical protein EYF80_009576 [Liparis tanakae]